MLESDRGTKNYYEIERGIDQRYNACMGLTTDKQRHDQIGYRLAKWLMVKDENGKVNEYEERHLTTEDWEKKGYKKWPWWKAKLDEEELKEIGSMNALKWNKELNEQVRERKEKLKIGAVITGYNMLM